MRRLKRVTKIFIRKMKTLLRILKRLIIKKKAPSFYVEKGKRLLELGKNNRATRILKRGLKSYPNNANIHKECAVYAMHEETWKDAAYHWEFVLKSNEIKLLPEFYLKYSKALQANKQTNKSIDILTQGLAKFPTNRKIITYLSDLLMEKKEWKKASEVLLKLFEIENIQPSIKTYISLSTSYSKLGLYSRAEYILQIGIKLNPRNLEILNSYAIIAIQKKDWGSAIQRLEYLCKLHGKKIPFDTLANLSMLYRIAGKLEMAEDIFDYLLDLYPEKVEEDKKGYRELILFDNGETRIEFYKKNKKVNKVIVTFDSLNMVWDNPSFGFKLLLGEDVDIIAIRKKRKKRYHQDLSLEEFFDATNLLVSGYKDKIAYGFSLGAYSALYFASSINCRILALAPRLSIHPTYGNKKVISKFDFKHDLSHNYNANISPIIVYDPKDKQDNTYIKNEVVQSFPNSRFVEVKYGGHAVAPNLLRMGVLKDFILTVISGEELPKYDRRLKAKSTNYCRLLGRACLKRNKLKWAKDLSERSLQLSPNNKEAIRFKVDVLRALNQYADAIVYIKETIEVLPKMLDVRLILIDLYIQTKDLIMAEKELNITIKRFSERPSLSRRRKMIEEKRELMINVPLNDLV